MENIIICQLRRRHTHCNKIRMKHTCLIKRKTAVICYGKVRENPDLPVGHYEISQIDKRFIVDQPGLQVINTVSALTKYRSLPLLIVNSTNKFIKIYRHGLLAKISGIQNNMSSVNSVIKDNICESKIDLENELDIPQQYRSNIEKLITENQGLLANLFDYTHLLFLNSATQRQ